MENSEFAYLLGMITGKGKIIRGNENTEIRIIIPHKNLKIEGMEAQLSVKASLMDIKEILEPLINKRIEVNSEKARTTLSFKKDNNNFMVRELNRHFDTTRSYRDFSIPEEIFYALSDIKKEYLRGISDVTAHIRSSNNAFGNSYDHRVYIEISDNWGLVIDIANLLKDLDVPVHTIDWAHPNMRDPKLNDYNEGKERAWDREHQIKIFADEFEIIGFKIRHKSRALERLAQRNREEWNKYVKEKLKEFPDKDLWMRRLDNIEDYHHKYYWERSSSSREKPCHPMVADNKIPSEIRGKNYNSWRKIAYDLGYGPDNND